MKNTVSLDEVREELDYLTQSLIKEMGKIVKSGKRTRTFHRNPEVSTLLAIFFGMKPGGIFEGIARNSRTSAVR
jgi:hypothetical protein